MKTKKTKTPTTTLGKFLRMVASEDLCWYSAAKVLARLARRHSLIIIDTFTIHDAARMVPRGEEGAVMLMQAAQAGLFGATLKRRLDCRAAGAGYGTVNMGPEERMWYGYNAGTPKEAALRLEGLHNGQRPQLHLTIQYARKWRYAFVQAK